MNGEGLLNVTHLIWTIPDDAGSTILIIFSSAEEIKYGHLLTQDWNSGG